MNAFNTYNRRKFITGGVFALTGILGSFFVVNGCRNTLQHRKKGKFVPTLKGELDSNKLGLTLMHEHVLTWNVEANKVNWIIPENLRSRSVEIAVKLLKDAEAVGVNTIVDMLPLQRQYINLYREIASKTNINIIVSTGYYVEDKTPDNIKNLTELEIEDRMYREVKEGYIGTNIRAGIIKIASNSPRLTDWEKKVYRSAARIQKETGVPIGCHAWTGAREQLDILMQHGADPNHINFAHIDTKAGWENRTREQMAERLLSIVKDGGYLLFNDFHQEFYTPWKDIVYLLRYFCDKGYANRIFTSMDCNWQWKDGKQVFEEEDGKDPQAALRTYAFMVTYAIPEMKKAGFSNEEIDTFLVQNPRNFFAI